MLLLSRISAPLKLLGLAVLPLVIVSCGGDSGASNNSVVGNSGQSTSVERSYYYSYSGNTPPADEDVQNFRTYFWSRLAGPERCGACHVTGGDAANIPFAAEDNINVAYNWVMGLTGSRGALVDKTVTANSLMVSTIAAGHQGSAGCWVGTGIQSSETASCASQIEGYISAWANASAPSSFMGALSQYAPEGDAINEGLQVPGELDGSINFAPLHDHLQDYCASCHRPDGPEAQQSPYFAVADAASAYQAALSRINVTSLEDSRLYERLAEDRHNCGGTATCDMRAQEILIALEQLVGSFNAVSIEDAAFRDVASRGMTISQGFILSNGNRVENAAVGLWKFKEGMGSVARSGGVDRDGNLLTIDLTLSGDVEWWGSGGVRINEGKLQASSQHSKVLHDTIRETGEYSIEAWLVPLNVTQGEGDDYADIVSYSRTTDNRNFMLSQREYIYDFYNRLREDEDIPADSAGEPRFSTPMDEEIAQAALQHVVVTYSASEGSKIYVDGEEVASETDPRLGAFTDWRDDYFLTVGNEVSNGNQWQGSVRLLAIHNAALSADDVKTNFDIGVGDKYYLMFPISHLTGVTDTYVVFQVEEFDEYSYLFTNPIFYSKDESQTLNLPLTGMRIGINSREASSGQAYVPLALDGQGGRGLIGDNLVDEAEDTGVMQVLSTVGTLVPKELGIAQDQFFLTFESIAGLTYTPDSVNYTAPVVEDDNVTDQSDIGIKDFAEINATLISLTGVDPMSDAMRSDEDGDGIDGGDPYLFDVLKRQMPVNNDILTFSSANQMAIAQLSFKYCDVLVETNPGFFAGVNMNTQASAELASTAQRNLVIDPLLDSLLANAGGTQDQPSDSDSRADLSRLINDLAGNGASTSDAVKSTCAAAYGSALMLIQ